MSVKVPTEIIIIIDKLVNAGLFTSRSEFVRCAMSDFLIKVLRKNKHLLENRIDIQNLLRHLEKFSNIINMEII